MKNYLEELIDSCENNVNCDNKDLAKAINEAKEILNSPQFIEQRGIRSLVDKDARVGHKTKTSNFFGYKAEFTMLAEEKIITSVSINNGAYVDGENFNKHIENTELAGVDIRELYGDKAYFRKPILKTLEDKNIDAYIPLSASAYKMDETDFKYNKDSDQWICKFGNYSIKKNYFKRKDGRHGFRYYFDKSDCESCPHRKECYKGNAKSKLLTVGADFEFYEKYSKLQKTDKFLLKYKSRASIENKNAEMKRFHGLSRSKGSGLIGIQIQTKLTVLAVNLKRIAKLFIDNKMKIAKEMRLFLLKNTQIMDIKFVDIKISNFYIHFNLNFIRTI